MIEFITFDQAWQTITSKDAYGNAIPFDVEFVTANKKTKEGGRIIKLTNVVNLFDRKAGKSQNHFLNGTINVKPAGPEREQFKKIMSRHSEIYDGRPTRIHTLLILKINDQIVSL